MIALIESVGSAVLRASWQAAALAIIVAILLWALGERLSPRWRCLLWSIVVLRFLLIVTPASPWSAFNLVPQAVERAERQPAELAPQSFAHSHSVPVGGQEYPVAQSTPDTESEYTGPIISSAELEAALGATDAAIDPATETMARRPLLDIAWPTLRAALILSIVWLLGVLWFALRLAYSALLLRRRLSICQSVSDRDVIEAFEHACKRISIRSRPGLLVTPEAIAPCIVGTWKPRIVLPESLLALPSRSALRHVLAHELAHLVRADLWTNWLLLAARALHWFNPAVWMVMREVQAERESACDEMALAALNEDERSAYASTLINLATGFVPSTLSPSMIGLVSSAKRLRMRLERLSRFASVRPIRAWLAGMVVLFAALLGLTDSMPSAIGDQADKAAAPSTQTNEKPKTLEEKTVTLAGLCLNEEDRKPIAGAPVRLFEARGHATPVVEIAKTETDAAGRFEFAGLTTPRPEDPNDPLVYLAFVDIEGRPLCGSQTYIWPDTRGDMTVRIPRESTSVAGTVVDARGTPVSGAAVSYWSVGNRTVPGIHSATTDGNGRFKIERLPLHEFMRDGVKNRFPITLSVFHPRHPLARVEIREFPGQVAITLSDGCRVTGSVLDAVAGKPAAGAVIVATRLGEYSETTTASNVEGRFEMALPEDNYNFSVIAKDRICAAVTNQECIVGQMVELPAFKLIGGGFIEGRVVNTSSGKPVAITESGGLVAIGLVGPSQPLGRVISPKRLALVDAEGRFKLRAAPGENFPYFVNIRGDRMAWDTTKQPAVVVKEGETTAYDMLITPEVPPAEKLKAAQKLIASLSKEPASRTTQILIEFRALNNTVDECELWCSLMRELVLIGKDAVPQLCEELDRTTEDRMLRRLGFALRAIGDPRAVPALIRAIPKTLVPAASDYGLIVADALLTQFMQTHDLDERNQGSTHFGFGRAVREVFGALHKLTGQDFADSELFGLHRSNDLRRQILQRRHFTRTAQRWQSWWEMNARRFTDEAAYQKVDLVAENERLPLAAPLGENARVEGVLQGATLSPPIQGGQHAQFFHDLDTGFQPKWPAGIPKDEARIDPRQLAAWASERGVDLMCVTHRGPDGKETFVLRSFGLRAWEITPRDLRNLDKLIAAGTLPKGPEAGELLMHYDEETKQHAPGANAAFIYVTRDGSMGVIEITDQITRTADLRGAAQAPAGVGFFKGVKFNLKAIIP